MPELDRYAPFVLAAFGLSALTLGSYAAYLASRLRGLRRALRRGGEPAPPSGLGER